MANKKQRKGDLGVNPALQSVTLREENIGKKHTNVGSILKMEHLQKLAMWTSGEEASIPCLAALFGYRLAANAEAAGVPLDRSLFVCHKCETLLQPGDNCTVRIEKNIKRTRHRKKSRVPIQNNVIYTCHFCLHRNVMMGTAKGHVKELLASRVGHDSESKFLGSAEPKSNSKERIATNQEKSHFGKCKESLSFSQKPISEVKCHSSVTPGSVLSRKKPKLDGSSKVAISGADDAKSTSGSSKRKKKGWSSLKQIVESNEHENKFNMSNLVIPFKL